MKLSLATRNFLGYAVVLVTFGAVSVFSVAEMHRNQQEVRLVSQGYLHLSQDAAAIETLQKNRVRDTARLLEEQNAEARRALVRLSRLYFPPLMAQRLSQGQQRAEELLPLAPGAQAGHLRELVAKVGQLGMEPNPQMKTMLYFMPVMMTGMFLFFPSGLNLYYAVSNFASIPQQWMIAKERQKLAAGSKMVEVGQKNVEVSRSKSK